MAGRGGERSGLVRRLVLRAQANRQASFWHPRAAPDCTGPGVKWAAVSHPLRCPRIHRGTPVAALEPAEASATFYPDFDNRSPVLAISRIAQACSWAGPKIEVIVRDNSGDADKRALLSHFQREHCKIIIVRSVRAARELFGAPQAGQRRLYFLHVRRRSMHSTVQSLALPEMIEQSGSDPTVAGVTGAMPGEFARNLGRRLYKNVRFG